MNSVMRFLGLAALAVIMGGTLVAQEPAAPAAEAAKPVVAEEKPAAATGAPAAAPQELPAPRQVNMIGITLVNPANQEEAVLLIQVNAPGPDGKPTPQMIGVPLVSDEKAKNLIGEFGIVAAKDDDPEAAKKVQEEAMQKVVMVDGILSFTEGGPQLKVNDYKHAAPTAVPAATPAPAKVPATEDAPDADSVK